MLNRVIWRSVIAVAVLLSLVACSKKASDEIDFGTVSNSIYQNKYFGLTVTLPENWRVQDQKSQARLMKKGVEHLAGDDKEMKELLKASETRTVNLFAAFKHPFVRSGDHNPSIVSIAEVVRDIPEIERGKDYLSQVRETLDVGQMQVSFPRDYYTEQFGGREFDVMDIEISVSGKVIKQKYCSRIEKGYALSFLASFTTDEDKVVLQGVLDSVKFD